MHPLDPVALTVDARNLACPLPVIRARRGIGTVTVGEMVEVLTTDPGSIADFRAWTQSTGHELVGVVEDGPPFKFLIRRVR